MFETSLSPHFDHARRRLHPGRAPMTRVVNIDESVAVITALCEKFGLSISTMEPLPSGGTRVVTTTADGAADLRKRMKGKLLDGAIVRSGLFTARQRPPR